jgi:peptidoglycan/LPS O-acetylase OafA/YrhL
MTHAEYLGIRRFGVLDGLRAIAILLVFTAHQRGDLWPAFHGATGVTLFFVLSGHLITTLLLREEDRSGKVDFASFYVRRTFRIYPMFLGVIALYCVLILGLGMDAERRALWIDNLPYIVWFPEHLPFFRTSDAYPPFSGAWSIGIEEKFYLVWPVLGFVLLARWKRARVPVLAVLAAASFVTGSFDQLVYLAPYQHLASGAIAAVLLHRERTYPAVARLGRPPVLLTVVSIALVLQFTAGTEVYLYGALYGLHGLVLALLLAGLVTTRSPRVAWLSSRPMAFLAAISYTFYLIHGFFVNAVEMIVPEEWGRPGSLLSAALALVLSIFASWIVHRLYEEPLRTFGVHLAQRIDERRAVRRSRPVRGCEALPQPRPAVLTRHLYESHLPAEHGLLQAGAARPDPGTGQPRPRVGGLPSQRAEGHGRPAGAPGNVLTGPSDDGPSLRVDRLPRPVMRERSAPEPSTS